MSTPSGFSIFPITEVKNLRFQHSQPELHSHPHHQVFILTRGGGRHLIDGQELAVKAPWAMVIAQGKQHLFFPKADTEGWGIGFTDEFLPPSVTWFFSSYFELSNLPLCRPGALERLDGLCRLMHGMGELGDAATWAVVQHLLAALLNLLLQEVQDRRVEGLIEHSPENTLFQRFVRMLDERHQAGLEVGWYAQELRCTPRRLAAVCQRILGKSPSDLVEERRMQVARRRLLEGEDTVQRVALDLGYEDPSYFTKAFRRVVGETPSQYREARRLVLACPPKGNGT